MIVVFPVPGPPVITITLELTAVMIASRCAWASVMPISRSSQGSILSQSTHWLL